MILFVNEILSEPSDLTWLILAVGGDGIYLSSSNLLNAAGDRLVLLFKRASNLELKKSMLKVTDTSLDSSCSVSLSAGSMMLKNKLYQ